MSWTWVGACVAFVVTQAATYWQMLRQSRASLEAQLTIKQIDLISEQLAEFYNPLYALLSANGDIVEHFGPNTFPPDEILGEAAAENWRAMRGQVIIPNNEAVAAILRSKSHLMAASDDISNYLKLNNHLALYKVFVENRTEAVEQFRFPADILQHIRARRAELVTTINRLKAMKQR
jgi:hypothetical protein